MWVKAYKLLRANMTSINEDIDYTIKYIIGESHIPKKNTLGLFVFDTLENAIKYNQDGRYYFDIYECVVEEPYKAPTISDVTIGSISLYYDSNRQGSRFTKYMRPPQGTLLTQQLILLNKVQ